VPVQQYVTIDSFSPPVAFVQPAVAGGVAGLQH
jgi:hypothetical protein